MDNLIVEIFFHWHDECDKMQLFVLKTLLKLTTALQCSNEELTIHRIYPDQIKERRYLDNIAVMNERGEDVC